MHRLLLLEEEGQLWEEERKEMQHRSPTPTHNNTMFSRALRHSTNTFPSNHFLPKYGHAITNASSLQAFSIHSASARFYTNGNSPGAEFPLYPPVEMKFTHSKPSNPQASPNQRPLILLHGLFGNKMNFLSVTNLLNRQYGIETYSLDMRNHGVSPHSEHMNFLAVRNDLKLFLDSNHIEECDIFGFSLGGRAVMSTLLDSEMQKYFRKAIIGDISPVKYTDWDVPSTIDKMRKLNLNCSRRSELQQQLKDLGIADAMMRDFLLSNVTGGGNGEPYRWRINLEGIYQQLSHIADFPVDPETMKYKEEEAGLHVKPYDKPVLVVRGEDSNLVKPDQHMPLFQKYFPQVKMISYEKTGHWVHFQDSKRFAKDVNDFLLE